VVHPRGQQRERHHRPDDQPRRLGREDQRDQQPAALSVGVLAGHDRAHRVVAADPDAEDEAEGDEPDVARRQRRGEGAEGHDPGHQPVHPGASHEVGDPAEDEGAHQGGEESGAPQEAGLDGGEVPLAPDEDEGHADDEEVVRVSEEAHGGGEGRLEVEETQGSLVERLAEGPLRTH
jgi:hypothetical protein